MIVRQVDYRNDWKFGKGKNDYLRDKAAVAQSIRTRVQEFLGDCFFNTLAGVDWFNLLGGKDLIALNLRIKTVILNTQDVVGVVDLTITRNSARGVSISYEATTVYEGALGNSIIDSFGLLLTEEGDILVTEDGEGIGLG